MTPQFDLQRFDSQEHCPQESATDAKGADVGGTHLSADQFGELLARAENEAAPPEFKAVEAHLLVCEQCSAELAELRQSLALFRGAISAYADDQMQQRPRWVPVRRTQVRRLIPVYWATAAAAMFLTALLPMQVLRQRTLPVQPTTAASSAAVSSTNSRTQSDEMLLEDVDREVSASVPTPMQALADPTASDTTTSTDNSVSNSSQRTN